MTVGRRTGAVATGVLATGIAVAAYLASLGFSWAVVGGAGSGYFRLISRSSGTTALLSVLYLLLTLVALGFGGAALYSFPARRWYAGTAALAALLDLGATGGVGYRLARVDGVSAGLGWYLAAAAVLVTCVAVCAEVAAVRR